MSALLVAAVAAYGVHLTWTSLALRWSGLAPGPKQANVRRRDVASGAAAWLAQAGVGSVSLRSFLAVSATIGAVAGGVVVAVIGAPAPALAVAALAATAPSSILRSRRRSRRLDAHEAWPRMIEEIRLLTGSVGRSVPHALFDAGRNAPIELADAFAAAHREWLLTTDFAHTVAHLKRRLADPTADAACETLLIAHQVGGANLDARLVALAEDRTADLTHRKDALAKQAGVRFARRFVLIVPLGMAAVGLSIGDGKAAYASAGGQMAVLLAIAMMAGCWAWAGRLLRLPDEQRVFGA